MLEELKEAKNAVIKFLKKITFWDHENPVVGAMMGFNFVALILVIAFGIIVLK